MDEFEMRSRINGYIKEISHYSQMQVFATSYYQKNYFQMQIDEAANGLINLYTDNSAALPEKRALRKQQMQPAEQVPQPVQSGIPLQEIRRFTVEELAYYDGEDGRPAYVAANGIVYDVTNTRLWEGGSHFGQSAGRDLTEAFMGCHSAMPGVLQHVPQVGVLE